MIRLYQFGEAWGLPDPSPFCMKVITYLRLANIDFESVAGLNNLKRAPKGKLPYIDDEGTIVADSDFIIAHLQEKYGNPLSEPTDARQRGALRAITRMLDEDLYFSLVHARWINEDNWKQYTFPQFFRKMPLPVRAVVPAIIRSGVRRSLKAQGRGRHAPDEIMQIGLRNLEALRNYLGDNPFIAGRDVSVADATVYAFMAEIIKPPHASAMKEFAAGDTTLMNYVTRMEARLAH